MFKAWVSNRTNFIEIGVQQRGYEQVVLEYQLDLTCLQDNGKEIRVRYDNDSLELNLILMRKKFWIR